MILGISIVFIQLSIVVIRFSFRIFKEFDESVVDYTNYITNTRISNSIINCGIKGVAQCILNLLKLKENQTIN